MKKLAIALSAGLLAGTALAACSSDESASSEETMVGGMTECTQEILSVEAVTYAESLSPDNTFTTDSVDCADGWAVANGILGPKDAPADGPQGAPTALIFQQEGQFWIPKVRQRCVAPTLTEPIRLMRKFLRHCTPPA